MKKKDIEYILTRKYSYLINNAIAKDIVNIVFDSISESLKEGDDVDIFHFGRFEVKERFAHEGINPKTKEKMLVPASNGIKFSASKHLKKLINE